MTGRDSFWPPVNRVIKTFKTIVVVIVETKDFSIYLTNLMPIRIILENSSIYSYFFLPINYISKSDFVVSTLYKSFQDNNDE